MRYLDLGEALLIGEAVTGIKAETLDSISRTELLDSALHAPQATFDGIDLIPDLIDKAAVLLVHVARNHPLPDGNKRLAWECTRMFLALNGRRLQATVDDAVELVLAVASSECDPETVADWLMERVTAAD